MAVVNEITAPLEIDSAEEIIIRLGAAISARRIYATGHSRTQRSIDSFLSALDEFPYKEGEEHFEFTLSNGMLLHRGIPLGINHAALPRVSESLDARGCKGIRVRRDTAAGSVVQLVSWLSERLIRPMTDPPEGIELLTDATGEALRGGDTRTNLRIADFKLPNDIHCTSGRVLDGLMEQARQGTPIDFHEIVELTQWVSEAAFSHGTQLVAPTQTRCQDLYTFHHSVNVFLIATTMLKPLAKDRAELARFAQAALLHDVGKSRIPHEVLHKRGRLTDEEFRIMSEHPVHGAEILAHSDVADPLVIEAAYCHHMRDDGLGYPTPSLDIVPGPVTHVIQVADMFEALTAHRPYHRGRSAWEAVSTILQTPGMTNRRHAIALLLELLTQSPPGCEVTLATGEKAVVVKAFKDAPGQPLVSVFEDKDGAALAEPKMLDLREDGDTPRPIREVCLKPTQTGERRTELRIAGE